MSAATVVSSSVCPECSATVGFARPPLNGQVVGCIGCGVELEVVSRDPLVLALAPEVQEDWGE
jgi:alpha-aminoadipate carrier protein LysW